jgi:hypothetical protein
VFNLHQVSEEVRNTRSIYKKIIETKKDGIRRRVLEGGNNRETETKHKKEKKSFHVKTGVRGGTLL